jgi:hypothetical protein
MFTHHLYVTMLCTVTNQHDNTYYLHYAANEVIGTLNLNSTFMIWQMFKKGQVGVDEILVFKRHHH